MKKFLALLLVLCMAVASCACGQAAAPAQQAAPAEAAPVEAAPAEESGVYNVAYVVNGNLGDKSFFDSA